MLWKLKDQLLILNRAFDRYLKKENYSERKIFFQRISKRKRILLDTLTNQYELNYVIDRVVL